MAPPTPRRQVFHRFAGTVEAIDRIIELDQVAGAVAAIKRISRATRSLAPWHHRGRPAIDRIIEVDPDDRPLRARGSPSTTPPSPQRCDCVARSALAPFWWQRLRR